MRRAIIYSGRRLYKWRRLFSKNLIVTKLYSNYKFANNQRKAFFALFLIVGFSRQWFMFKCIHAVKQLGIHQNWIQKSSSLYWNNCLPLWGGVQSHQEPNKITPGASRFSEWPPSPSKVSVSKSSILISN